MVAGKQILLFSHFLLMKKKIVAEMMKEVATQKIVVSISDDGNTNGTLQQLLPYSRLVKVSRHYKFKKDFYKWRR